MPPVMPDPNADPVGFVDYLEAQREETQAELQKCEGSMAEIRAKIEGYRKAIQEMESGPLPQLKEAADSLRKTLTSWDSLLNSARAVFREALDEPVARLNVKRGSIAAVVAEILANVNRPLPLDDIVVELMARGYGKKAADFRTVVNTALWRRKELFKKDENGLYSLTTNGYGIED